MEECSCFRKIMYYKERNEASNQQITLLLCSLKNAFSVLAALLTV